MVSDYDIDVVIESTGIFTGRENAAKHLGGSVGRVVISAPSGDADATICMGVNDSVFDADAAHRDLERVVHHELPGTAGQGLNDRFGIEQGLMTTVHAYTSDQSLVDLAKTTRSGKADLRKMRAAGLSIIPASTGAARAIGLVLPELKGKLDGTALRVPTPTGSITDLSANLGQDGHRRRRSTTRSKRPRTTSRTAACSSTPRSSSCRPTSSATRRRASSRPRTRWPTAAW